MAKKGGGSGKIDADSSLMKTKRGDFQHPNSGDHARGLPRRQQTKRAKPRAS